MYPRIVMFFRCHSCSKSLRFVSRSVLLSVFFVLWSMVLSAHVCHLPQTVLLFTVVDVIQCHMIKSQSFLFDIR